MEPSLITVETDIRNGIPMFNMVGLADITINEAKERIRAALSNSGYKFPNKRTTVCFFLTVGLCFSWRGTLSRAGADSSRNSGVTDAEVFRYGFFMAAYLVLNVAPTR